VIENREEDLRILEARARTMLGDPALLPVEHNIWHHDPVLHPWVKTAFKLEMHWVLYTPGKNVNPLPLPLTRKVLWDRARDCCGFQTR
jgi:hypothetical protein